MFEHTYIFIFVTLKDNCELHPYRNLQRADIKQKRYFRYKTKIKNDGNFRIRKSSP